MGCAALPKEYAAALCGLGCDPNCDPGPSYGYNHIDWAVEMRDGGADKVIDFDTCMNAFKTELGGCASGSEQYHDGFWFRIDPSTGACPWDPGDDIDQDGMFANWWWRTENAG